jgi:protein gp37
MAARSRIEWTEQTWNPVTGCTKLSAGCKHCYAETLAKRLKAMGASGYERGFALTLHPDRIGQPLHRRKPTMYFVNSMSDLFHQAVPFGFIDKVLETIRATPRHCYQILTKRPEVMAAFFKDRPVPTNAWLGASVENRRHGVPRIEVLRGIDAQIRFLSVEPLLEDLGVLDLKGISWVIVGGESGPRARPMKPKWARSVQLQCMDAGVPFFFKQWGSFGSDGVRRAKGNNGRVLDGRTWDEMPA